MSAPRTIDRVAIAGFLFGIALFLIQLLIPAMGYQESYVGTIVMLIVSNVALLGAVWMYHFGVAFHRRTLLRSVVSSAIIGFSVYMFYASPVYEHRRNKSAQKIVSFAYLTPQPPDPDGHFGFAARSVGGRLPMCGL